MPPPVDISNRQICDALSPYGISPDKDQVTRIRDYISLLLKWNRAISLTSITDPAEIVGRHFGESMYASRLLSVENCRLADVGTGAGFPGLALKIVCPNAKILLIDSNKKKCAFLFEVVRELGLEGVELHPERFEEIRPDAIQANVITARAVGEFKGLIRWAKNALVRRGHLMLWVGAEDSARIVQSPPWTWQPAVRIPESQRRFILIGRPIDETSLKT